MFDPVPFNRRQWLKQSACGFGYLALTSVLAQQQRACAGPLDPRPPHREAKAKRVIFIFLQGSPSQLDTFDYKPKLQEDNGKVASTNSGDPPSTWVPPGSSNSTVKAVTGFPNYIRTLPGMRTSCAS